MEAISTNVSSLRAAAGGLLSAHPRDPHLLKTPSNHHHHHHILPAPKPKLPSSSLSHQPFDPKPLLHLSHPRSPSPLLKPLAAAAAAAARAPVHRRASTGYAAALLDAARCGGVLDAVERDVRRLAGVVRRIRADSSADEARKGEAVVGVAEGGGFDRRLVALVRMLVGKQGVGMVGEVMEEFGRIHDELSGATRVVLVSSERRMEEEELAGIARDVLRACGAAKVKVRHLYREVSPRFAV